VTEPVPATPETIAAAAAILREGGVVAIPTETVYGLAANALDAAAVARVFEIKRRPSFDPLIVHVCDVAMLERVACAIPAAARRLVERFWPGPLTIVLSKSAAVPAIVTAGASTVAVRLPSHSVAQSVIRQAGVPLAAPSANPFGAISPTRAQHVARALGELVDMILDGGPSEHGVESTIVSLVPSPAILRPGAIDAEAIADVTGPLSARESPGRPVVTPGSLAHHYAPRTPLLLLGHAGEDAPSRARAGWLGLGPEPEGYAYARSLSPSGDLREAAAALFDALHELDGRSLERIDVEPVPEHGIGVAIMDRLRRAASASS
jgi:L-threonylcarbamoyladenylate synthase